MKLAIVYPGMGKRPGERYLRSPLFEGRFSERELVQAIS